MHKASGFSTYFLHTLIKQRRLFMSAPDVAVAIPTDNR
jgi:hypothetical protein